MTREEKKRQSRLAKNRKNARAYRARQKEKALAEEKAKLPQRPKWRRPCDPPEPGEPQITPEPRPPLTPEQEARIRGIEPETPPTCPMPQMPPTPKPSKEDRSLAADKRRQERAVKRALAADDDLLKRLFAMEDKVLNETENRFIREGDGTPSAVIESDCRICGSKKSGRFTTNYCCSACIGSMSFPYHNGGFDDREPNIRAMIAKLARLRATKLTVECAECEEPVPDPDGLKRDDQLCDRCYAILFGESRLDRRSLMGQRF